MQSQSTMREPSDDSATDPEWLSAHVYFDADQYGPQADAFLAQRVRPLVAELEGRQLCGSFFFLRYFDWAPHLRLRFRLTARDNVPSMAEIVRDQLMQGAGTSQHKLPGLEVVWRSYRPEYLRYGGPKGVAIAEALFAESSRVVLTQLHDRPSRGSAAVSDGLAATLAALSAAMTVATHASVAHMVRQYKVSLHRRVRELGVLETTVRRVMEDQYVANHPQIRSILVDNDRRSDGSSDWSEWKAACGVAAADIRSACRDGALSIGGDRQSSPDATVAGLFMSYLHMMNNRLGTRDTEEAFVAFAVAKLFEEGFRG